jgi:hypothetical protein
MLSPWRALRLELSSHHFALLEHLLDHFHLVANEEHIGHIELLGIDATRFDDEVAGADAQDPVAKRVAAAFSIAPSPDLSCEGRGGAGHYSY